MKAKPLAPPNAPLTVDIQIDTPSWKDPALQVLADRAAVACLSHLGLGPHPWEIAILATDDHGIARLNQQFRGKAKATNVLSWPSAPRAPQTPGRSPAPADPDADLMLGDIALAYQTCAKEAASSGKTFDDHVSHLIVHGILHLLGYDHETDLDAALMECLEVDILAKMGVADPYAPNTNPATPDTGTD